MGAVKWRTQVADMSQYSFGRVPCVIFHCQLCSRYLSLLLFFVWTKKEGHFFSLFSLGNQRKWQMFFTYAFTKRRMYETRKLRKGSFKETCFFGSASVKGQETNKFSYWRTKNFWKILERCIKWKSKICTIRQM